MYLYMYIYIYMPYRFRTSMGHLQKGPFTQKPRPEPGLHVPYSLGYGLNPHTRKQVLGGDQGVGAPLAYMHHIRSAVASTPHPEI